MHFIALHRTLPSANITHTRLVKTIFNRWMFSLWTSYYFFFFPKRDMNPNVGQRMSHIWAHVVRFSYHKKKTHYFICLDPCDPWAPNEAPAVQLIDLNCLFLFTSVTTPRNKETIKRAVSTCISLYSFSLISGFFFPFFFLSPECPAASSAPPSSVNISPEVNQPCGGRSESGVSIERWCHVVWLDVEAGCGKGA